LLAIEDMDFIFSLLKKTAIPYSLAMLSFCFLFSLCSFEKLFSRLKIRQHPSTLPPEKFENAAFFLWFGLPSTLIGRKTELLENAL